MVRAANYQKKGTGLGAGQAAVEQICYDRPKIEPYNKRQKQLYEKIQGREDTQKK